MTVQVAPFTTGQILPWLQTSAMAAVKQCVAASAGGVACGRKWYAESDDGTRDVGNQMTAMSIVQANLIQRTTAPVDYKSGNSTGDASAGNGASTPLTNAQILATRKMTTADKVGAWIVTAIMLIIAVGWAVFILAEDLGIEALIYGAAYNQKSYAATSRYSETDHQWYKH